MDQLNLQRRKRRAALRTYVLPAGGAAVGLLGSAVTGFAPTDAILNAFQDLIALAPSLRNWLVSDPSGAVFARWIAAPLGLFVLLLGIGRLPFVTRGLERLVPDPAPFLRVDLDAVRRQTMTNLERGVTSFVGRTFELESLRQMFGRGSPMQWRLLLGPSGIGKTRLAIEWLEEAGKAGFEVGFVDEASEEEVICGQWTPSRPTAIVFDEARTAWDQKLASALIALAQKGTARNPIRVLIIDQIAPDVYVTDAEGRDLLGRSRLADLRLAGVAPQEIALIAADSLTAIKDPFELWETSAGRPRAAIIATRAPNAASYVEALVDWTERLVPQLRNEFGSPKLETALPLIAAAIGGPMSSTVLSRYAIQPDFESIAPFFPGSTRAAMQEVLPALQPDDLGQELSLRLLQRLDSNLRERLLEDLATRAPARMERFIQQIWRDRPDIALGADAPKAGLLRQMQSAFDAKAPERVADLQRRALALSRGLPGVVSGPHRVSLISELFDIWAGRPFDLQLQEAMFELLVHVISAASSDEPPSYTDQPERILASFDRWIDLAASTRLSDLCAGVLVNGIGRLGERKDFIRMDRWGVRLDRLLNLPEDESRDTTSARLVLGFTSGIFCLASANEFDRLEIWGARLARAGRRKDCLTDPEVGIALANAAYVSAQAYASAQLLPHANRWAQEGLRIFNRSDFSNEVALRQVDARLCTVMAPACWKQGLRDAGDEWEQRLMGMAVGRPLAEDLSIRIDQARMVRLAVSAVDGKLKAKKLQQGAAFFAGLARNPRFANEREIRIREVHLANEAITHFGEMCDWTSLESWGARLEKLAHLSIFKDDNDVAISLARAAVNATNAYSLTRDAEGLGRWGRRMLQLAMLTRLRGNAEIGWREAMVAVNIINACISGMDSAEEMASVWRERLANLAMTFPQDTRIQQLAAIFQVGFSHQIGLSSVTRATKAGG